MAGNGGSLSVPYARLRGEWEVLRQTDDGRTTIAVRDDEQAGVAIGYPYAEPRDDGDRVLKVAVVRNVRQGFVLVSASFVSFDALESLAPTDQPRKTIDLGRYNRLSDETITSMLSGNRLVLLDVGGEQWYPGAIQMFDDPEPVRETWLADLPRVRDRLAVVERILKGVGLHEVATAESNGPRLPSP